MEKEAMRRGRDLPHSTIATALKRESLPRTELVEALVSACGCDEETVARWVAVRQRLGTGASPAVIRAAPAPLDPLASGTGPARSSGDAASPVRAGGRVRRLVRSAPLAARRLAGL